MRPGAGIDLSVYQGIVNQNQWKKFYDEGYRVACIGTWHGGRGNPYAIANFGQASTQGVLSGDKSGAPGCTALLPIVVGKQHALFGNAINIGGLIGHDAPVIGTDIPMPISSPQITRILGLSAAKTVCAPSSMLATKAKPLRKKVLR